MVMENPSIIMPLLNSQVTQIKANSRLAAYVTADGNTFLMGKDFTDRPGASFVVNENSKIDL